MLIDFFIIVVLIIIFRAIILVAHFVYKGYVATRIDKNIAFDVIKYDSSIDDTKDLYATVCYPKNKNKMPIIVYMHGYSSNRSRELDLAYFIAQQGFFVVSVDMRGRGTESTIEPYKNYKAKKLSELLYDNFIYNELNIIQEPEYSKKSVLYEYMIFKQFERFFIEKVKIFLKYISMFGYKLLKNLNFFKDFDEQFNQSGGYPDDGAKEIYDIYDAIEYVKSEYDDIIDINNINGIGLSGGGGSMYSLATKFPDYFQTLSPFFGISDYEYWFNNSNTSNRKTFQKTMIQNIGGTPLDVPNKYKSRNSLLGVKNNKYTNIHIFWDEYEVQCPAYMNLEYINIAKKLGYTNVYSHESQPINKWNKNEIRAMHVYPFNNETYNAVNNYLEYIPKKSSRLKIDSIGTFTILGYIKVDNFFIIFNNGDDSVVDLNYNLKEKTFNFNLVQGDAINTIGKLVYYDVNILSVTENDKKINFIKNENLISFDIKVNKTYKIIS